jgi:hypothetical protein
MTYTALAHKSPFARSEAEFIEEKSSILELKTGS